MCGIIGSVNCDVSLEYISKRGPDNSGVIEHENVSFGHTRLAIIDLSENSNQPIENNRYVLTYNGEWYDYRHYFPLRDSDTLALFQSITFSGIENTLKDINGMFAFGVYDRLQKKIYCAVDRFGQKPLYYYHNNEKFAFASTPSSLLHLTTKEINMDALNSYWLLGSTMGEDSIWKGIKKLCAGELLEYDLVTKLVTVTRWYEPKFYDNAERDIEDLVIDAIDKVKISDVPIHIFLSGGIDSTLVASRFKGGKAVHLASPESKYAQQAANKFNIELFEVNPTGYDVLECMLDYSSCGEPSMAGLIPYIVSKEVSKFGKVAISANGADELFFGYNRTSDRVTPQQIKHTYRTMDGYTIDKWPFNLGIDGGSSTGRMFELGGYVQFDLNKTLDYASMAHGLEVRCPFLDHRLVECALSIPEKVHRKNGNKTILKNMLTKLGFSNEYINRRKLGFSLHYKPPGLEDRIDTALGWCIKEGWLDVDYNSLSGRDQQYIGMSALGFYYFCKRWL